MEKQAQIIINNTMKLPGNIVPGKKINNWSFMNFIQKYQKFIFMSHIQFLLFLYFYFLIFLYFYILCMIIVTEMPWTNQKFYWKTNLITERNIQQNWQLYILWVRWVNKLTIENMAGTLAIYWFSKSFWHPKSCSFVVKSEIIWYKS